MAYAWTFPNSERDSSKQSPGRFRARAWSNETGYQTDYQTLNNTPISTPIKKSFLDPDAPIFSPSMKSADSFFQPVASPTKIVAMPMRAITKKIEPKDLFRPEHVEIEIEPPIEIDAELEESIQRLAKQIVTDVNAQALWCFEDVFGVAPQLLLPPPKPLLLPSQPTNQQPLTQSPPHAWKYPVKESLPQSQYKKKRYYKRRERPAYCEFCKNNDNPDYKTHRSHNDDDEVTCPVLFELICPRCGETGARAHTKRYCPLAELCKRYHLEKNISK